MTGKLNDAQLELLSMFSNPMSEERLKELRKILMEFRAQELSDAVGSYLEREKLAAQDILKEHMRTPYKTK